MPTFPSQEVRAVPIGHLFLAQSYGQIHFHTSLTLQITTGTLPVGFLADTTKYFVCESLLNQTSFQISLFPGGVCFFATPGSYGVGVQTGSPAVNQVRIGGSLALTLINLVNFLNSTMDGQISLCNYSIAGLDIERNLRSGGIVGNVLRLV